MDSIGHTLKAARESKNMEIQDVSAATLMQPHVISAIETDDFAAMPAPVYARGFIRLYAESMGLDPAPFIDAYNNRGRLELSQQKRKPGRARQPAAPEPKPPEPSATAPNAEPIPSPEPIRSPSRPPAIESAPRSRESRGRSIRLRMPSLGALPRLKLPLGVAVRRLGARLSSFITGISWKRIPRPDAARIIAPMRAKVRAISARIGRIPTPSVSTDAALIVVRSALAALFLAASIAGILWMVEHTRPRVLDSRLITEPPAPYVDFHPPGQ